MRDSVETQTDLQVGFSFDNLASDTRTEIGMNVLARDSSSSGQPTSSNCAGSISDIPRQPLRALQQ